MFITIFTPTFNRGYIIEKLYRSLLKQKYKNFEWIIIDNGSDETEKLIDSFIKENAIKIVYRRDNERVGINRAYNDALKLAKGDLFFKVDDDDSLTDDALYWINYYSETVDRAKIAGISGLRIFPDGSVNGGEWKNHAEYLDVSNFEREKYQLGGDKAEAYFTDILRKYGPFPEIYNEKYTDEALLYYRIANAGYSVRWINKKIYLSEYLSDGVTSNWEKVIVNNPITYRRNMYEFYSMIHMPFSIKLVRLSRFFYVFRKNGFKREWMCEELPRNDLKITIIWIASYAYLFTRKK